MTNPFYSKSENTHFYPIIFVRGFAMRDGDIEKAVAEPFSGFENGSTLLRQGVGDDIVPFYFESPVIRLITDCGYEDVYQEGREPQEPDDFDDLRNPERTLWVYRYYEQASEVFGDGDRDDIETLAHGLYDLVENIRNLYVQLGASDGNDYASHFKVFLVAHSMGGLIVRSYLQKVLPEKTGPNFDPNQTPVDKVFTYGTPHNGIELRGLGNRIKIGLYDISNFYRPNMARYLGYPDDHGNKKVHDLNGKFPAERLFSLVGTNERDYDVPLSATVVGAMSDGLVRISNAYTKGSPRAHVHRSHGGPVGIVNSESGYQNLHRFFFGDTKVEGRIEIKDMTLPKKIEEAMQEGRDVEANVYFETVLSTRGGKGWQLTRRKFDENSAARRQIDRFFTSDGSFQSDTILLFSTFLRRHLLVNKRLKYMAFALDLGVMTDRIEVDRKWWVDEHFDGVSFLRQQIILEVGEPDHEGKWPLKYTLGGPSGTTKRIVAAPLTETSAEFRIPVEQKGHPGTSADLILTVHKWA